MHLVVCVKQVANPELQYRIRDDALDIVRDNLTFQVNGPDEYALEEAVRLKEAHGGTVTALAGGPERVTEVLRQAMAKGADEAIRLDLPEGREFDPAFTGRALAQAIQGLEYDLVLCGVQSDDYAHAATGPILASHLGIPHASVVTKVEVEGAHVRVNRELEGGIEEQVTLPLPALLTIQFGINEPRFASVAAILRATRQTIREMAASTEEGPGLTVRRMYIPEVAHQAEMLEGSGDEVAQKLAALLREKGFVPEA
ncbi:MAG: electron transfer flavoprotein subunit beta/FixA family protein [Thermoplasmata archaeon]|jgi:electron transfer flavoprotein beta subunit